MLPVASPLAVPSAIHPSLAACVARNRASVPPKPATRRAPSSRLLSIRALPALLQCSSPPVHRPRRHDFARAVTSPAPPTNLRASDRLRLQLVSRGVPSPSRARRTQPDPTLSRERRTQPQPCEAYPAQPCEAYAAQPCEVAALPGLRDEARCPPPTASRTKPPLFNTRDRRSPSASCEMSNRPLRARRPTAALRRRRPRRPTATRGQTPHCRSPSASCEMTHYRSPSASCEMPRRHSPAMPCPDYSSMDCTIARYTRYARRSSKRCRSPSFNEVYSAARLRSRSTLSLDEVYPAEGRRGLSRRCSTRRSSARSRRCNSPQRAVPPLFASRAVTRPLSVLPFLLYFLSFPSSRPRSHPIPIHPSPSSPAHVLLFRSISFPVSLSPLFSLRPHHCSFTKLATTLSELTTALSSNSPPVAHGHLIEPLPALESRCSLMRDMAARVIGHGVPGTRYGGSRYRIRQRVTRGLGGELRGSWESWDVMLKSHHGGRWSASPSERRDAAR
ncbi:uncharacterized protein SCHCODRAFT_02555959 [Schizophyllum commune H4-8]|nr:uncharacterized protein SCHCODRAFT_02555959 [Schizophyllum commune H4-8]KAI5886703.1 hypothetical protein SCHCODRAFT_02555959 [Schizophyllum commune H4-8]